MKEVQTSQGIKFKCSLSSNHVVCVEIELPVRHPIGAIKIIVKVTFTSKLIVDFINTTSLNGQFFYIKAKS